MANSKATKKALLGSVVSLLLCFTMLIGATFAWFTDNVKNTGNKILAGNLEVQLLMHDGDEYIDISDISKPIFGEGAIAQNNHQSTLWEPGKTQVVYLGIRNGGNLALKYNVILDIVDGGLIGSLEYALIDGAEADDIDSWADAKAKAVATGDIEAGKLVAAQNGVLDEIAYDATKTNETDYFALAVHMKEDAGNEYQGKNITIDVQVSATQVEAEEDSFGSEYDKAAEYDEDAPVAITRALSATDEIKNPEGTVVLDKGLLIDTTGSKMGADLGPINLETAYQFEPNLSADAVKLSEYKSWHADFVVSVDQDIEEDSIALAGFYDLWCGGFNNDKWVALPNDGFPVEAGEEIRLIELMGQGSISVSFKDLCDYGNDGIGFLCGAMELNDKLPANTTLKVELRLYEATDGSYDSETGNYMTIGTYNYTFK